MTADKDQRLQATRITSRSFAVEASAGTGKTSTLVNRILHLVLEEGPGGPPVSVSSICAITFTEKAAGEMKIRLRQEFDKKAAMKDPAGERARNALRELDAATISTFHAFAVSLLKERPIEAGLDPHFTALDDLQSNLFFLGIWEPWIDKALRDREEPLEKALRQGISLNQVRDLATTLRRHSSLVRRLQLTPPVSDGEMARMAAGLKREGVRLTALIVDPADLLVPPLERSVAWLESPDSELPASAKGGKRGSWEGGKETVERVREFLIRVREFAEQRALLSRQRVFHSLARWLIDAYLVEWEKRKRAAGYLDFDDQLEAARVLLSTNRAARAEFQRRYSTLLVDEFQDTDPVQLEIVLLLSSIDLDEADPARMRVAPGRLFIVGDPKQSIYRFRGADVETYQEMAARTRMSALGLEGLQLTTNFRSVPSILRFVDEAFSGNMTRKGHYQSEYLPFGGAGARNSVSPAAAVYLLGDRNADGEIAGSGKDVFELEAKRIARLVSHMPGNRKWRVEDASGAAPVWREPRLGDIAILVPVLSKVEALEEALRDAGIPYVLEGGKFYYARSEVASAITVLRAIANPNDQIALYGALRSIFFGLSDEDLLRARFERLPMDYRVEVSPTSPLWRPFAVLKSLHEQRHARPASETLEALLLQTGAREVLAARGYQSISNLGKLARQLRSLQRGTTFSEVLSLLATIDEEELSESESRLMEEHSDAVRVLTIHKAKGLDFKIVILATLGAERGQHSTAFLADPHGRGTFGLKLGSIKDGWSTRDWEELKEEEKKREDAELMRLLYVALTRARDHLVLSVHTKGQIDKASGLLKHGISKTRLAPLEQFLAENQELENAPFSFLELDQVEVGRTAGRPTEPSRLPDCEALLRREYDELDQLLSATPPGDDCRVPSHSGEADEFEGQTQDAPRGRAIRLGLAFHEAMEKVNFESLESISRAASEAGARSRLGRQAVALLEEMVNNCLRSSILNRARCAANAGGRRMRELEYVRTAGATRSAAGFEEGKIDLLFQENGRWILVDYKTDNIEPGVESAEARCLEKYRTQVEQYSAAMADIGIHIEAAYLLLARTGREISVPLPSMTDDLREAKNGARD